MSDRMELLEAEFNSIPDGFAQVGPDGNAAFRKRAAAAIQGYASGDRVTGAPGRQSCSPS
jgi:PAS domain-containing protein